MKFVLFAGMALMLAGCGTSVWAKPGAGSQDAARETKECEAQAKASGYPGGGMVAGLEMQSFVDRCMVRRGYAKTMVYS